MPEFSDTDPGVMEVWLEILRAKTPEERIQMAFEMSDFAVRARYPESSEREVFCDWARCGCRGSG